MAWQDVTVSNASVFSTLQKGVRNPPWREKADCGGRNACPWGWIKQTLGEDQAHGLVVRHHLRSCSSRQYCMLHSSCRTRSLSSSVHIGLLSSASLPSRVINCRGQNLPERACRLPPCRSPRAVYIEITPRSYQPQAITFMTQARLDALAKHR
jgi:hypothetical protein